MKMETMRVSSGNIVELGDKKFQSVYEFKQYVIGCCVENKNINILLNSIFNYLIREHNEIEIKKDDAPRFNKQIRQDRISTYYKYFSDWIETKLNQVLTSDPQLSRFVENFFTGLVYLDLIYIGRVSNPGSCLMLKKETFETMIQCQNTVIYYQAHNNQIDDEDSDLFERQ